VVDIPAELARGCPSTAWNVGNVACHHWILGYYDRARFNEINGLVPGNRFYPCLAPQAAVHALFWAGLGRGAPASCTAQAATAGARGGSKSCRRGRTRLVARDARQIGSK
jgi:hypothetical protein